MDQHHQNGAEIKLWPGRELYHSEYQFEFKVLAKSSPPNHWWCAVPKNFELGADAPLSIPIPKIFRMQHRIILFDFTEADIGDNV